MNHKFLLKTTAKSNKSDFVDFRSDTVTKPSSEMRLAMIKAEVGDDVYGDDPNVNALEEKVAKILGKESGLFVTSGTQSNLCSMLAHCQRGEEIITGDKYHVYIDEAGGASVLGSIMMTPVLTNGDGSLNTLKIAGAVKPDDPHCPISRVLSLENTVSGRVQSIATLNASAKVAKKFGLSVHLDGARLPNAAIKLDVSLKSLAEDMDSVSLCLSKGLGAPIGSVLVGTEKFIKKAHRVRKLLGGGLRQSGILAAAGIYALENNMSRLDFDHKNAYNLAKRLKNIKRINLNLEDVQTNMIFIQVPKGSAEALKKYCKKNKILINADCDEIRLVTHLDIDEEKISYLIQKLELFFD